MIKFNATKTESVVIDAIVDRAAAMQDIDRVSMMMDIEACHCNGTPLRLVELLVATPFDFTHDLGGINRHLNRETGQLEDCFLPRYSL